MASFFPSGDGIAQVRRELFCSQSLRGCPFKGTYHVEADVADRSVTKDPLPSIAQATDSSGAACGTAISRSVTPGSDKTRMRFGAGGINTATRFPSGERLALPLYCKRNSSRSLPFTGSSSETTRLSGPDSSLMQTGTFAQEIDSIPGKSATTSAVPPLDGMRINREGRAIGDWPGAVVRNKIHALSGVDTGMVRGSAAGNNSTASEPDRSSCEKILLAPFPVEWKRTAEESGDQPEGKSS